MPISLNQLPGLGALNQAVPNKNAPEEQVEQGTTVKRSGQTASKGKGEAVALDVSSQARVGNELPMTAAEPLESAADRAPGLRPNEDEVRGVTDAIFKNVAMAVRAQASGLVPTAHHLV